MQHVIHGVSWCVQHSSLQDATPHQSSTTLDPPSRVPSNAPQQPPHILCVTFVTRVIDPVAGEGRDGVLRTGKKERCWISAYSACIQCTSYSTQAKESAAPPRACELMLDYRVHTETPVVPAWPWSQRQHLPITAHQGPRRPDWPAPCSMSALTLC